MNILIVGSGAKEYSMAKLFSEYENVGLVFVAPGNEAVKEFAAVVDIQADDVENLVDFAKANNIDMTIAASEKAIVNDISEKFNEAGLMIFAPSAEAARIAMSKSSSKKFMYKTKIPTTRFGIFDRENMAVDYARKSRYPLFVKADGHMHGENVYACDSFSVAKRVIEELFDTQHKKVIVEEYAYGQEFSYYIITDGYNAMPITSVVPYKYVLEGDGGAITSGVGAYAPFYMLDCKLEGRIFKEVIYPALDELVKGGNHYVGILGVDIVIDNNGKMNVLEFNPFFKEPDAQCVLELLNENLINMMKAAVVGSLVDDFNEIKMKTAYNASLVVNSGNYPSGCKYGSVIKGLDEAGEYTEISHFNTIKNNEGEYITAGGRTLVVSSTASTLEKAAGNLYESVAMIGFDGMKYRKDIAKTILTGC